MKTQYYTASTLDGFIADPEHTLDWLLQFSMTSDYDEFIANIGAVAMGSTTYEWVLRHSPGKWPYEQPAWVFTTRDLEAPAGADLRFVRGDVRPVHAAMKEAAGGRNVWIVGGGELAGQFHDEGLLDELIISIAPVTLGAGSPLLPRVIAKPPLRLVSVTQRGEFVQVVYATAVGRGG